MKKLPDSSLLKLEQAKKKKLLAATNAEKAFMQNEIAELEYKNVVLQIYIENGLSQTDAIDQEGNVISNTDNIESTNVGEDKNDE